MAIRFDRMRVNFGSPETYRAFVFMDLRGREMPEEIMKYLELDGL